MLRKEILIVFLAGMIPFLWYIPGYIIAKGDYFPYIFSPRALSNDFFMWSSNSLGTASSLPAYFLYGLLWAFLQSLNVNIGLLQMILWMMYLSVASFSTLYLAKTVYPKEKIAPTVASIFYVFNFLVMLVLLNIGMMWTYAFLPLLIALFMRILTTYNASRYIICSALVFAVVASISSINPAYLALIIASLGLVLLYYLVFERGRVTKHALRNLAILVVITSLLSVWWVVPTLNYYLMSPSAQLQQEVSVQSWSWTHTRSSFLNLFWLNGGWGWRPEYLPYFSVYSDNAVMIFLPFVPILLASIALFSREKKSKFTAYLMLIVLALIFLAKGLHEPLGFINLFLFDHIPYMSMFREPFSKFTLITIPFLALVVGHSTDKIARVLTSHKFRHSATCSKLFVIGIILIFIVSTFPMLINPLETQTEQLPYSTYVKIPQYWYDASEWLNIKAGGFRILVTPLDDYYQVPYIWGYYGTDTFIERLIQEPIISPRAHRSMYKANPDVVILLNQLNNAIKYNRTIEFETILSLLNVKYILQRNDLDYERLRSTNRDVVSPWKMRNLLSRPNITLVKTFGELDIYEFPRVQEHVHFFEPQQLEAYDLEIANRTIVALQWNFDSADQLSEWKNMTPKNQFNARCNLSLDNGAAKFELLDSTWGWKTIGSPLIDAQYGAHYDFELAVKGENAHGVHIKILEYATKSTITQAEYVSEVADGTFDWKDIQISYDPKIENTTFLQLQIWNGHETDKPLPNILWVDDVKVHGYVTELNTTKIRHAVDLSTTDPMAEIIRYDQLNPTRIAIEVNASRPFILAIDEAFDSYWKAHINGETYGSLPIFSVMNGFQINRTGQFEVVIEYEPQRWFYFGSVVSIITFIACTAYLTFTHPRTKTVTQKIKHKLIKPKPKPKEAREETNLSEPNKTN